jgi:hypothetical protein
MSELVHDRARRDAPRELLVTRDRSTLPRYESGKSQLCRGLLNWLLITGRGQLERVLRVRVDHSNLHRPYRALGLEPPDPPAGPTGKGMCTAATVSAGCSASTTDKLHEQVLHPTPQQRMEQGKVSPSAQHR